MAPMRRALIRYAGWDPSEHVSRRRKRVIDATLVARLRAEGMRWGEIADVLSESSDVRFKRDSVYAAFYRKQKECEK